ncbi:MAG: prepilin-type N-terminal cleavage/methylation domain-containing protein [Planctomycetes bacterium]|nr:prepilin-type N-terminal cleavage/methylation domain-containing protein [Planctomycetota bacterium]
MNPSNRNTRIGASAPPVHSSNAVCRPAATPGRRGFSLTEIMIVLAVTSILISMSAVHFSKGVEQSRADIAAANLRAIWTAERLYWLEYGAYTDDPSELEKLDLIHPMIVSAVKPYQYRIELADTSIFTASATRSGSTRWSGQLTIVETGTVEGYIDGGDTVIEPGFL